MYSRNITFIVQDDVPQAHIHWNFTDLKGVVMGLNGTNARFIFSGNFRVLTIKSVLLSDRGNYTLTATNEAGTRNSTINFDVHG